MKTLVVYDAAIAVTEQELARIDERDTVYLFPLTSRVDITNCFVEQIRQLGRQVDLAPTSALINSSADTIRDKYINFVANMPDKLSTKNTDFKSRFAVDEHLSLWWLSLIAEKNTFKSDSFNTLAQLDAIVRVIHGGDVRKVMFGCCNDKLKNALLMYCRTNHISMSCLTIHRRKGYKERFKKLQHAFYFKHLTLLIYEAINSFIRTAKIKRKIGSIKRVTSNDDPVMVITYYPNIDESAAAQGIFRNKYYPHLQEALESEKNKIVWMAMSTQNNSISFDKSLSYAENFIRHGHVIYFLEEFNSFLIMIKSVLKTILSGLQFLRLQSRIRKVHTFGEYNFYSLFKDDWYSSFAGITCFSGQLYYNMFKSMFSQVNVKTCLYYCEMHAWEKALITAKKATNSRSIIMGYQHATISRMLLNYFNHPSEIHSNGQYSIARPDKIICNGEVPYALLQESGWPREKLIIAEAIRYIYLKKIMALSWEKNNNIILIAFSISPIESSSILNMAYEALKDLKNIQVWIKPHPFLRIEKVFELSGLAADDVPFEVKSAPIEKLLSDTKLLISGESGVSIEALAFGCKVAIVNCSEWIDMSPLRNIKSKIVKNARNSDELKQIVSDILHSEYNPSTHGTEARRIINSFFHFSDGTDIPERFLRIINRRDTTREVVN